MAWYEQDSWATAAFAPKPTTMLFTFLLTILLPILLHQFLYRKAAPSDLPTFLLVGPSGGGKTAFLTLTDRNAPAQTHTSTTPLTISTLLPEPHTPASSHFRSPGDPAFERSRRFSLIDTPGHGKLRHFATSYLAAPTHVRGIIFMLDAAALADDPGLAEASAYLHDVLLALQKRYTSAKGSKVPSEIRLLVAANKMDLFTALPVGLVKGRLERGITEVRASRARGVRASGVDEDEAAEEEGEWLGEGGEGAFEFGMMEEVGVNVEVRGGNVLGKEGGGVREWYEWIAESL